MLTQRAQKWFPEREFFMRSEGQVRFLTISTRAQLIAAGVATALVGGWSLSMAAVAVEHYQTRDERAQLAARAASIAKAEARISAYRGDVDAVATDLDRRMEFIESLLPMLPEDVAAELEQAARDGSPKISADMPRADRFERVSARQATLVARLTGFAEQRIDAAEKAMRELGINPRSMMASAGQATGGPLQKLSTGIDGEVDPTLERLGRSLARMDALESGLASLPQVMPADMAHVSSGFGYRRDPFTGAAALHSGLDFGGRVGDPVHAAADGKVSFVGQQNGYGKMVEVTHGNGLTTRYAHMSAWRARVGQAVSAGDMIGAIGSTGRSTGPHLHFEVRINGRAVNPRPFLEAASQVVEQPAAKTAG